MQRVPEISSNIDKIKAADPGHPVYLVRLADNPTKLAYDVVVKAEDKLPAGIQQSQVTIQWGAKLMKNINNRQVDTKAMANEETLAFTTAVQSKCDESVRASVTAITPDGHIWTKMLFVPGLEGADYFAGPKDRRYVDLEKISRAAVRMLDANRWIEFGKIIAVDIFNANNDRCLVVPELSGACYAQIANLGNMMFNDTGSMIGLDTYFRNRFANLYAAPENLEDLNFLLPLKDKAARKKFAQVTTGSFGVRLKEGIKDPTISSGTETGMRASAKGSFDFLMTDPKTHHGSVKNVPFNELDKLFVPYAVHFEEGIRLGAEQLRRYLLTKHGDPKRPREFLPAGIWARMQYLKWV